MPGMPYDQFVDALRTAWPDDFTGRTPKQVVEDLLGDYPELETVLDPTTRDRLNIFETQVSRGTGKEQWRAPTWPERAGLLATRVAPAIVGGALGAVGTAPLGGIGAAGGGVGGAMVGEALAEGYEQWAGIAPASHSNILAQAATGAMQVSRLPGVKQLGATALGRTAQAGIEGVTQGLVSTEAEERLRYDRAPTMGDRAFGAAFGGLFGGAAGGGVEAVRAFRQVRAQGKMTRGQTAAIEAVIGDYDLAQQSGMLDRQTREAQLPFLTKLFGQIQDPALKQSAADRMERIFLAAHQDDLRMIAAQWTQDFKAQSATMPLHERLVAAKGFTDFLQQSAAERETIDQVATILAGLTTTDVPPMRLGLPPAPPDRGFLSPQGTIGAAQDLTQRTQGPFYGSPPEGPQFINRPDSELIPPGRMLAPQGPEPPPVEIERVGDALEGVLREPPGPPRLKKIDPGAGVLRRERLPIPEPIQPPLKGFGRQKLKMGPPPEMGQDVVPPGPLGRQFAPEGLEQIPRVQSGEMSAEDALFLSFIKADIEGGRQIKSGGSQHVTQSKAKDGVVAHGGPSTTDNSTVLNAIEKLLTGKKGKLTKTQEAVLSYARALREVYDPVEGFPKQPRLGRFDAETNQYRDFYDDSIVIEDEALHHARFDQWNAAHKRTPHLDFVPGIEAALSDEDWARQPRGLTDRWVPWMLAPEERFPAFAPSPADIPPEIASAFRKISDDDLIDMYSQGIQYGGIEPGEMGWVMAEIEARGLRQFRQPGLDTEGPGSPAKRNLPREIAEGHVRLYRGGPAYDENFSTANQTVGGGIPRYAGQWFTTDEAKARTWGDLHYIDVPKEVADATHAPGALDEHVLPPVWAKRAERVGERQGGLFDEPLPENATPELDAPEFSLTPEASQRKSVQPSLLPSEPPKFGERPGVVTERKAFTPAERPPRFGDEEGAVGKVGLPKARRESRATRQLVLQNEAYQKLVDTAKAGAGREVAGVLLGYPDGGVARVVPARNVAADPSTQFEISEPELRAIVRQARREGLEVLASYHTQPTGSAMPSKSDMRGSVADIPLVILGMDGGDVVDARVWQPGRNRQWAEGSLGVAQVKDPLTPPAFQDVKDVRRFVRTVPRLRAAPGDTAGMQAWMDKNRAKYEGEPWFTDAERLLENGQDREAWLQIQTMQLLGERAARAGARQLPDPMQSKQAIDLVDSLARGGAQDPVGAMFALYDGRTTTIPGVGRVVVPPTVPPHLKGSDVFVGPGGLIRPKDRTHKLVGQLTDGTLATSITKQFLEGFEGGKYLRDPSRAVKLFEQITEDWMMNPANYKALKALVDSGEITIEDLAAQYKHGISESARQIGALGNWAQKHADEIRTIEGIRGASGNVEDLIIRGHNNRVIGRLGDLTEKETFRDLVKPARAWDRVMLMNDLSRQETGAGAVLESSSRGFMISGLATAQRNLIAAGIRSFPETFALMMEGVGHKMAGNPGKAQAAFTRAAERAKIPYYIGKDGLWVSPFRAARAEGAAIYNSVSGNSKILLDLAASMDPEGVHLLGGVAFGEPTPHRKSKYGIINDLASPKLQNWLTLFNRSQEFSVRGNIYAAEMRAGLRNAGLDPDKIHGMSAGAIAEAVGGQEKLQGLYDTAVHQALNFSFAGDLIRTGFGKDIAGAKGSIPAALVDILNRFPILRAGYPFPRFNFSAAPRFLWDHSLIGLALDPLYAKTFKRGRYFLGTKAQQHLDVNIPEAERGIAAANADLGNALMARMTLSRRLQTYQRMVGRAERQVSKAIDAAGAQPEIAGLADKVRSGQRQLDLLRAERNSLQDQLQKTVAMRDEARTRAQKWEAQKKALQQTVTSARAANAPMSFEQLLARQIFGGGAMLGAAYAVRSLEGAEGTPWYIVKINKPFGNPGEKLELDFRPFAPFAQYLFIADAMKDLYEHTAWTDPESSVWADMERGEANNPIALLESIYNHYEGKYTSQSLKREIGNAFLSMSQVAGTTLALADIFLSEQGVPDPGQLGESFLRIIGSFLARFTIPFAQIKAITDLADDEESKARIATTDRSGGVAGYIAPLMQPVANLPFMGQVIPETINQVTGKPLDTYAPLWRALTGVTVRERTQLQDIFTESGLPGSSVFIRSTGEPFLDKSLAHSYSNILNRALPQILDNPDWQRLNTPATRRDFLQKLLPRLKKAAIGEVAEVSDPEDLQSAREGREGRRRRLRMERLERLLDQEGLRDRAPIDPEEPEPPEPELESPEPGTGPPTLGQAGLGGGLPSEPPRLGG